MYTSYACWHAFKTKSFIHLAEIHHHCICSVDPARGRCINRGPLCRTNQTPFMRTAKTAWGKMPTRDSRALFAVHTFSPFIYSLTSASFSDWLGRNVALPSFDFSVFFPLQQKLACLATCALAGFLLTLIIIVGIFEWWMSRCTTSQAFSCGQLLRQWTASSRVLRYPTALRRGCLRPAEVECVIWGCSKKKKKILLIGCFKTIVRR